MKAISDRQSGLGRVRRLKARKQDACIYVFMCGDRTHRRERHRHSGFRLPEISVERFHSVWRARAAVGLSVQLALADLKSPDLYLRCSLRRNVMHFGVADSFTLSQYHTVRPAALIRSAEKQRDNSQRYDARDPDDHEPAESSLKSRSSASSMIALAGSNLAAEDVVRPRGVD